MAFVVYGILFILLAPSSSSAAAAVSSSSDSQFGCFKSIISFGDSLADTGNDLIPLVHVQPPTAAKLPFGRTFFHHPTGRYSDGRLVIDFIAQSLGLPLVLPYVPGKNDEGRRCSFSTGVNFAVAGATALADEYLERIGCHNPATNVSLGTQLEWFKSFLGSIPDSRKHLSSSLVLVGEIGGNDYNHFLYQGASIHQLQPLAAEVTNYIGSVIQELIKLGAVTMLVPGNFPIGCLPVYLTQFQKSSVDKDYDPRTGCLNWLNEFSEYHNELLQKELSRIRELHPHVNIMYADYYNAAMSWYHAPSEFGFGGRILKACCGVGGPYNYNASKKCGHPEATSCDDPASYASWDGVHFTEAAYRLLTKSLLQGPYTSPPFTTLCPNFVSIWWL